MGIKTLSSLLAVVCDDAKDVICFIVMLAVPLPGFDDCYLSIYSVRYVMYVKELMIIQCSLAYALPSLLLCDICQQSQAFYLVAGSSFANEGRCMHSCQVFALLLVRTYHLEWQPGEKIILY
jgi:hypothetical protein